MRWTALLVSIVVSAAPAARGQTFVPVLTDRDYAGPSIPDDARHPGQQFNLFVPPGSAPPSGWPVVVMLDLGGFVQSRRLDVVDQGSGLAFEALSSGIAVVSASCTVARGPNTSTNR